MRAATTELEALISHMPNATVKEILGYKSILGCRAKLAK